MTIYLEDFVDKEVILTLNAGKAVTIIKRSIDSFYSYWCTIDGHVKTYTKDGVYDVENFNSPYNIKSIQLKNQPKPMTMTKLSDKTFQQLADTLTSDVIDYIHKDERYVLFMQEVIPDALSHLMGQLDDDLNFELSMAIMDRIVMKPSSIVGIVK